MDSLLALWTAAPTLKVQLLIILILCQMGITVWCYSAMSKARVAAVKANKVTPETYRAVGDGEPEELRVYTRLVANQFELPVLFYAIVIAGLAINVSSWITVVLAAVFVITRVRHAREMVGEHVVLRRRKLFIQSARVTLLLMLDLLISALFFLQV